MPDETRKPSPKKSASSHVRTSKRRPGHRMTAEQTREAQEKFLKSFASNGNVRAACLAAGIDRSTVRYWEEHDEQFSLHYNLAQSDVDDAIRAEIYRRGMFGDEEPMVSMGKVVTRKNEKGEDIPVMVRRKSDILLMFHAKSRMPEYRDKQQIEHTGKDGGPIHMKEETRNLSEDDLQLVMHLAAEVRARKERNGDITPG